LEDHDDVQNVHSNFDIDQQCGEVPVAFSISRTHPAWGAVAFYGSRNAAQLFNTKVENAWKNWKLRS